MKLGRSRCEPLEDAVQALRAGGIARRGELERQRRAGAEEVGDLRHRAILNERPAP